MTNEILKDIIIDHFGIKEEELFFNDLSNFHMSLGDAIDIAEAYEEKIRDQYPSI